MAFIEFRVPGQPGSIKLPACELAGAPAGARHHCQQPLSQCSRSSVRISKKVVPRVASFVRNCNTY
eukprot:421208-Pelagomonas_calceolata.AAC.1